MGRRKGAVAVVFRFSTHEKLNFLKKSIQTGHWVGQQRSAAGGGSPKVSSTKKKGK